MFTQEARCAYSPSQLPRTSPKCDSSGENMGYSSGCPHLQAHTSGCWVSEFDILVSVTNRRVYPAVGAPRKPMA